MFITGRGTKGSSHRWRLALTLAMVCGLTIQSVVSADAAPAQPPWRLQLPWETETISIRVGDETIVVELANTPLLRERGLGYRDGLEPGTGMLFVYRSSSIHTFWMKGMRFCIDIIWIEDDQIVGAAANACHEPGVPDTELARYTSPEEVTFVLEVPAGWLESHGFGPGTPVEIDIDAEVVEDD